MGRALRACLVVAVAAVLVTGCTVDKSTPPPLAGPSELGLALGLSAYPDQVQQDGRSQAVVAIQARNASGEPVPGLALRVEISVGGVVGDVGSLSTKGPVTGADGRATVTYTAPLSADQAGRIVTILVTPIGSDYAGSMPRSVDIRLVPPGGVQPPNNLVAGFTIAPDSPKMSEAVLFSALPCKTAGDTNCTQGSIVSYAWNFGDGSTGSGQVTSHAFATAGNFVVTLTVTGTMGETKTAARVVQIGSGTPPTADFVFSPTTPAVGQQVVFNASASKAAAGRTIVSYQWDFGYGSGQSGITAQTTYPVAGTYTVTLVVTDDIGQKGSKSQTVTVPGTPPTADFVFSPTDPVAGQPVFFNASASKAATGRTIISYVWDFGDGSGQSGIKTQTTYPVAGTYTVTLVVTDDIGQKGSKSQTVTVK